MKRIISDLCADCAVFSAATADRVTPPHRSADAVRRDIRMNSGDAADGIFSAGAGNPPSRLRPYCQTHTREK